jgi:hypothetical protein
MQRCKMHEDSGANTGVQTSTHTQHLHHILVLQRRDDYWNQLVVFISMAKSTPIAVTPRQYPSVAGERCGVRGAEGDLHNTHTVQRVDRHGKPRVAPVASAQLAQIT